MAVVSSQEPLDWRNRIVYHVEGRYRFNAITNFIVSPLRSAHTSFAGDKVT